MDWELYRLFLYSSLLCLIGMWIRLAAAGDTDGERLAQERGI